MSNDQRLMEISSHATALRWAFHALEEKNEQMLDALKTIDAALDPKTNSGAPNLEMFNLRLAAEKVRAVIAKAAQ